VGIGDASGPEQQSAVGANDNGAPGRDPGVVDGPHENADAKGYTDEDHRPGPEHASTNYAFGALRKVAGYGPAERAGGVVLVIVLGWLLVGFLSLVGGHRLVMRRRGAARDPLRRVFKSKELRELDAYLEVIAELEQRSIEAVLARYLAGVVGHVVVISASRHGVSLELSDGGRLALGSVSFSTLSVLRRRAADEKLYPARVVRDGYSYRLLLRGEAGADIELGTRRLALALVP
jgi:hypothetical protein